MAGNKTNNTRIVRLIGSGILLLLLAAHLTAQAPEGFKWHATGNIRSVPDLEEILRQHRQWLESGFKAGTQAKLDEVDLTGADLTNAQLNLAILNGAYLMKANLTNAKLILADLKDAKLYDANLTSADLAAADLTNASVNLANFDRAIFEPRSLPILDSISQARNLELLTYRDNPAALVQLRKQFEDGGLLEQGRKITYAVKRREAELSWERGTSRTFPIGKGTRAILWSSDSMLANFASFTLNKVFFDWTCQYGMSPGRPLILGVVLWFLCSFLYFVCIHTPAVGGLYRVYSQSIGDDPSVQERVERICPRSTKYSRGPRWVLQFFRRECLLLRASMFFSLMSAFNIGVPRHQFRTLAQTADTAGIRHQGCRLGARDSGMAVTGQRLSHRAVGTDLLWPPV